MVVGGPPRFGGATFEAICTAMADTSSLSFIASPHTSQVQYAVCATAHSALATGAAAFALSTAALARLKETWNLPISVLAFVSGLALT